MAHSVFIDGFNYASADILLRHTAKAGTMTISPTGGPRGNPSLRCGAEAGAYLRKAVPSCQYGVIGGLFTLPSDYSWPSPPAGATNYAIIAAFWGPTNINAFLAITPARALAVYRARYTNNGAVTLLAISSDGVVPFNVPTFIEFGAKIATAGSVEVRVNGSNVVIEPTSANTSYDTETIQAMGLGADGFPLGGYGYAWYARCGLDVSDLYYAFGGELAFQGINWVRPLTLTGDATPQDFAKSTADPAWQILANRSGYVSSDVAAAKSLFDITDVPIGLDIKGMQVSGSAVLTEAGSTGLAMAVKSGAVTAESATLYPSVTLKEQQAWFPVDPNTSAAWTSAGVNAATVGPVIKL